MLGSTDWEKVQAGGLCAHTDAPTIRAQTQNVTYSQGWPCAMVFSESEKVAVGMIRHVGFIKTCEFTHKGGRNACEGYFTQGCQTPPPPLANGAPKEKGRYHQGVRTWTPVEYSKLLPSILPQSASPPNPSCIYTWKEVNSEAVVTRACSIFDKP